MTIDRTDPRGDLDLKLTPEELDEFWNRAWKEGLVHTVGEEHKFSMLLGTSADCPMTIHSVSVWQTKLPWHTRLWRWLSHS